MKFRKIILPALYVSYIALPVVSFYVDSRVRMILAIMVVALSIGHILGNSAKLLPVYLPVFFSAALSMFLSGEPSYTTIYFYFNLFVISLIGFNLLENQKAPESISLSKLTILMLAVTCATTTIGNRIFPGASRQLAGIGDDMVLFNQYMKLNIGGFDLVYMMVILFPLVVCMIRCLRNKFVGIALAFLIVGVVLETGYGYATLFFFVSLILFFGEKTKDSSIIKRMLILLMIMLIVYDTVLPSLLNSLADIIPSKEVAIRFRDLSYTIAGSELGVGSDVEMRNDQYMMSVDGFLKSPLWGSMVFNSGGHSFVLDNLCIFGLLGALLMIWMIRQIFYHFIEPFSKAYFYGYLLFSFILYITCLVVNPQPYLFCVTFAYPIFTIYLTNKEEKC